MDIGGDSRWQAVSIRSQTSDNLDWHIADHVSNRFDRKYTLVMPCLRRVVPDAAPETRRPIPCASRRRLDSGDQPPSKKQAELKIEVLVSFLAGEKRTTHRYNGFPACRRRSRNCAVPWSGRAFYAMKGCPDRLVTDYMSSSRENAVAISGKHALLSFCRSSIR